MLALGRSSFILKHYYYEIPYWIFIFVLFVLIRFSGLTEAFPEIQIYQDRNLPNQIIIAIIGGLFLGALMATSRLFLLKKVCYNLSVGRAIIFQTISALILLTITLLIISQIFFFYYNYSSLQISDFISHTYTKSSLLILYGYFIYASIQYNLLIETDKKLGINVLKNLIMGKYHTPKQEERIFMFMDMKSSTSIAEKLGHLKYSRFLQDVFKLLTDIVIYKKAEIYQFVGDEVVLSWPSSLGYQDNNTLQFFYAFQTILEENKSYFISHYNTAPMFKAGIHKGVASVAEVGEINTQIAYHGDVVNTTSRIQELCNTYNSNLLVSDSFMKGMEAPLLNFQENAAEINLRGRSQPITIYALDVAVPAS